MSGQLALALPPPAPTAARAPEPEPEPARQTWSDFARANPHIVALLVKWTDEARAAGRSRVGMKALFERVRADTSITTAGGNGFKLDNTWTADAARHVAELRPELATMFEFRRRKGEPA